MKRRTRRFWKRTGDGVEPDDSRLPTHVTVLGALLASSSFFWNLACGAGSSGALTPPPTVLPPTLAKSFGSATSSLQVDTCVRVQFATVDSNYAPVQTAAGGRLRRCGHTFAPRALLRTPRGLHAPSASKRPTRSKPGSISPTYQDQAAF